MAWVILFLAGLFEVAWAVGLKSTAGFTKFWPSGHACLHGGKRLSPRACRRDLQVGTAYAVWTGIGAVGTVIFGILVGEPRHAIRLCASR